MYCILLQKQQRPLLPEGGITGCWCILACCYLSSEADTDSALLPTVLLTNIRSLPVSARLRKYCRSQLMRRGRVGCVNSPLSVVDSVSEAWRVNNSQLQLHTLLLDVHCVLGDLHRLTDSLCEETVRVSEQFTNGDNGDDRKQKLSNESS